MQLFCNLRERKSRGCFFRDGISSLPKEMRKVQSYLLREGNKHSLTPKGNLNNHRMEIRVNNRLGAGTCMRVLVQFVRVLLNMAQDLGFFSIAWAILILGFRRLKTSSYHVVYK